MAKIYKVVLKALSPIAVTKRQYNILFLTEYFIPGWTVWGALVKLYGVEKKNGDYKKAQQEWEHVCLTNFYVMKNNKVYLPKVKDNIKWGHLSTDKFAQKFIASEIKVSIDPLTNTSAEGMLCEREFIKPVEFIGGIKINDVVSEVIDFLNSSKEKICFIGADKNTGFGSVRIKEIEEITDKKEPQWILKTLNIEVKENYEQPWLIPLEMSIAEDKKQAFLTFPFVLRLWNEKKGSGEEIKYLGFVQFPSFNKETT
ncbi:MAG: hypothetical protein J7M03_00670 [Candidatus Desulfofervidaceae bacterium]|nr:hypothetical protein [Candidatus Desulfofervidaceae bacterium]